MTQLPLPNFDLPEPGGVDPPAGDSGATKRTKPDDSLEFQSDLELLDAIFDADSPERLNKLAAYIQERKKEKELSQQLTQAVRPGAWRHGQIWRGRYQAEQRLNSIRMILLLRQPVEVEPFIAAIWDRGNPDIRLKAATALGEIGLWYDWASPQIVHVIHALKIALRHQFPDIRKAAAEALGKLSAWEAADTLMRRLEIEKVDEVREAVALALGALHKADAVLALLDSYESGELDYDVCLDALLKMGDEAVETLISVVRRWNVRLISRHLAADALGRIKNPAALEPLQIILTRPHEPEDMRIAAAEALGRLGGSEALTTLRWIYHEPWASKELLAAVEKSMKRLSK